MSVALESIKIVGLYPFVADEQIVQEARDDFWGGEMTEEREAHVQGFFRDLYLIELEISPANADIKWETITQPCSDQTGDYQQVPYFEERIGETGTRWAFFFHYLDRSIPLSSPVGDLTLPEPTNLPTYLEKMAYVLP